MTTVTLGRAIHLFVACFAGLVTKSLVDFNLGRGSFVALSAVVSHSCLVGFVIESNSAFLVLVGVAVSSDSNIGTDESQQHHHDYQFFHFFLRLVMSLVWAKLPQFICAVYILTMF